MSRQEWNFLLSFVLDCQDISFQIFIYCSRFIYIRYSHSWHILCTWIDVISWIIAYQQFFFLNVHAVNRNIQFFGFESQRKVTASYVVVIGLGGVGSHAASLLLRSGVGKLLLVDFDQVSFLWLICLLMFYFLLFFLFGLQLICLFMFNISFSNWYNLKLLMFNLYPMPILW